MQETGTDLGNPIDKDHQTPLESLGLSVRTRNALLGVGCRSIDDIRGLDLSRPIRGLGRVAKEEVKLKLDSAGLLSSDEGIRASQAKLLESQLSRLEARLSRTLRTLARELNVVRRRIRKLREM